MKRDAVRFGVDVRIEARLNFKHVDVLGVAPEKLAPVSYSTNELMRRSRLRLSGSLAKLQGD